MQKCFIIFIVSLALPGCASMYSNYSEIDKQSYPKASADANTVTVLISDKDNTYFSIDGKQIGGEVQAGGELKILINQQSHDIIAQPKGYQPKPQHIQPPYDEHSPISFGFTYKDKQNDNKKIPITASVPLIAATEQIPAYSKKQYSLPENSPVPIVTKPATSSENVKLTTSPITARPVKSDGNNQSGRRVALVIGNSKYQYITELANPTHDAEDIAKVLRDFDFEVIERKNLTMEDMDSVITEFGRKISNSEAALFYFAGHALQVKGQNFLVPVDAKNESEAQATFKSINVNQILEEMDNGKSQANIVILDACRNNPSGEKVRSGVSRGLAAPSSQPRGTVIVYATDPGNTADDGYGRNGLFTAGLLTAFKGSDLSLSGVLTVTSEEVERESKKKQSPYVNGPMTLQKNFYFYRMPASTDK